MNNRYLIPFALVTSLFFLWGLANSLNGILISHFQLALDLKRWQAGLIDFAFYLGYFCIAIPAGLFMHKYGFKKGILLGLVLYAAGALLFYPAAEVRTYGFFLFALFTIASGLAFLETAANPYVSILGDSGSAEQRINFAQSFNGLSIIFGPLLGSVLIFSDESYTKDDLLKMPIEQADAIRLAEAQTVQLPYIGLACIVLLVALLFWITRMPEPVQESDSEKQGWQGIFGHRHLTGAVIAQFCYVGAQACIWGYFIDFKLTLSPDAHFAPVEWLKPFFLWISGSDGGELTAARWAGFHLSFGMLLFMLGRFIGTFLMSYIKPPRLLTAFAAIAFALMLVAINTKGLTAVTALIAVFFFMSIMFPTIFALGTKNLGEQVKIGSSLIIMAIVGGALLPPILGLLADRFQYQPAFLMPALCFLVIGYYGWKGHRLPSAE
ncbi:MAG: L-fucose:H+ symporter permease [Saprospiraceae bacterium]|nr:L-fucose:H+ symporter permease [Saprospiraceae bacterium]